MVPLVNSEALGRRATNRQWAVALFPGEEQALNLGHGFRRPRSFDEFACFTLRGAGEKAAKQLPLLVIACFPQAIAGEVSCGEAKLFPLSCHSS